MANSNIRSARAASTCLIKMTRRQRSRVASVTRSLRSTAESRWASLAPPLAAPSAGASLLMASRLL